MAQPASDDTLAKRAAGGDMPAFEELYERHHARVYTLCLRLTGGSVQEAEGLTHEAFVQAFRQAGDFRGEPSFTAWLRRLAVNVVLTHFRERGVRMHPSVGEVGTPEHLVLVSTANMSALPVIDAGALDRAAARLPTGYRIVFVLHDVEGYEHEEIARLLGIATGESKSQLREARMRLRELLRRHPSSKPQEARERNTGDAHTDEDG